MVTKRLELEGFDRMENHVDLGEFGDFYLDHILYDPDYPGRFQAVGTLHTFPQHVDDVIEIENAILDVDIDPCVQYEHIGENPTAMHLFKLSWAGWHTDSVPAEWKY